MQGIDRLNWPIIYVLLAKLTDLVWLCNTLGLMHKSHKHNTLNLVNAHKVFVKITVRSLYVKYL